MKTKTVIAVSRTERFSPHSEARDRAIYENACAELEARGFDVVQVAEDSIGAGRLSSGFYLSMARSNRALEFLRREEERGAVVVNSPSVLITINRFLLAEKFSQAGINVPQTEVMNSVSGPSLNYPFWVKNINPFTRDEHDVAFISSEKDFEAYRQESESRHDISTIAEEHIEGDLIKFYGVGEGFFYYYYPTSDQSFRGKFNNESVNGAPHNISFDKDELRRLCRLASGVIGLPVYGGDAVIDRDGNIYIVDFNDFPSFGACRKMAAKAIVDYIETKYF